MYIFPKWQIPCPNTTNDPLRLLSAPPLCSPLGVRASGACSPHLPFFWGGGRKSLTGLLSKRCPAPQKNMRKCVALSSELQGQFWQQGPHPAAEPVHGDFGEVRSCVSQALQLCPFLHLHLLQNVGSKLERLAVRDVDLACPCHAPIVHPRTSHRPPSSPY